jgi:hypothetical protein
MGAVLSPVESLRSSLLGRFFEIVAGVIMAHGRDHSGHIKLKTKKQTSWAYRNLETDVLTFMLTFCMRAFSSSKPVE